MHVNAFWLLLLSSSCLVAEQFGQELIHVPMQGVQPPQPTHHRQQMQLVCSSQSPAVARSLAPVLAACIVAGGPWQAAHVPLP